MEAREHARRYTYKDYASWPDDVRVELIDGIRYAMAPAPHPNHQYLHAYLFGKLAMYLDGKPCTVVSSPFDVIFPENEDDIDGAANVTQPDLLVICQSERVTPRGHIGAPTFLIEITSPSTADNDYTIKRDLYQRNGVKEYWIVSPPSRTISQYTLIDGAFATMLYRGGVIASSSMPGFQIDLTDLFGQMLDLS